MSFYSYTIKQLRNLTIINSEDHNPKPLNEKLIPADNSGIELAVIGSGDDRQLKLDHVQDIYIAGVGESHMDGRDSDSEATPPNENVLVWNGIKEVMADLNQPPFNIGKQTPIYEAAHALAKAFPSSRIHIIFSAQGGATLAYWWNNGAANTGYNDLNDQIEAAGWDHLDYLFWIQGSNDYDAGNSPYNSASEYKAGFQDLFDSFRGEDWWYSATTAVIGELPKVSGATLNDRNDFITTVNADEYVDICYARSDGLVLKAGDSVHYSGEAARILGQRMAAQITSAHYAYNPNIISFVPTPASANSVGAKGDVAYDDNYLYICVGTDTWKRTALTTWVM